jgi:hypothetical protein
MPKIKVTINGTSANPWHAMCLEQNPFPQIGRMEYDEFSKRVSSLDADPIDPGEAEAIIRGRLKGCSEEFVKICLSQYKPGERVKFEVTW